MIPLTSSIKMYIFLALAIAVLSGLGYSHLKAYSYGKQVVLAKLQEDRIKILKDGKEIDAKVLASDDDALCAMLGGC